LDRHLVLAEASLFNTSTESGPRFLNGANRYSDDEKYFLLREMHHRVANSFTILDASLRRELGSASSLSVQEILDRCSARIVAFGELHRVLIVGAAAGWIPIRPYIERLCDALSKAFLKPLGVSCEVAADEAFFPSEYCEMLGLVVAELVINAAKHAFPERKDGLVRIEFLSMPDGWTCIVSDNGVGMSAMSIGAGSNILATLLRALRADVVSKSGRTGTSAVVSSQFQPEFLPATKSSFKAREREADAGEG
jgi:two-component sensor histidine kinase